MERSPQARAWFADAAAGFVELVSGVTAPELDQIGLGEWTVRDLIGHTGRALSTVENYLQVEVSPDAPFLADANAYFAAVAAGSVDHRQVAERGRAAGRALGEDPAAVIGELAQRVLALVEQAPDSAPVATLLGPMQLVDYLPTRGLELTVHGLDLAYALDREVPDRIRRTVPAALALLASSTDSERAITAVRALTGRTPLPAGFTLL